MTSAVVPRDGRALRTYLELVSAATVVGVGLLLWRWAPDTPHDTGVLAAVGGLALGCVLLNAWTTRRSGTMSPLWDVTFTWLFCAAVVLPLGELVLLSLVLLVDATVVVGRPWRRASTYWASSLLAVVLARAVAGWDEPRLQAPVLLAAAAVTLVVQLAVVGVALVVESGRWRWPADLVSRDGLLSESVCLGVGGLLAVGVVGDPWLVVLAVPVVLLVEGSFQLPRLRRDAQQDAKTGLDTDAHWRFRATGLLADHARSGRHAAVLVLDVDRFKEVNDSVGHLAGDAVLAAVADAVSAQLREGDVLGRFGGDEFVALLTDVDAGRAHDVGERMRAAVAAVAVDVAAADGAEVRVGPVTISVGVAVTTGCGHDLQQLLLAADGALLGAKQSGRDRVRVA